VSTQQLRITLAGSEHVVEAGTTAGAALKDLADPGPEIGSGLPVFHPRGGIIRRVMEDCSRRRHEEAGYEFVRTAQRQKVPYMLIAGDDDVAAEAVSFRYRDGSQNNGVPVDEAIREILTAIRDRVQV
jgi:threonyl-tRNA synthetase